MKKLVSIVFVLLISVGAVLAQNAEMSNDAKKLYNEGNKLLKSGDYNGALAKYDEALKIDEDYRLYYQKSIALKKLRKYNDAEVVLKKCIELNPDFPNAYNGLGTTYYALKKYQLAVDNFEKFAEKTTNKKLKKKAKKYISIAYTKLAEEVKKQHKKQEAVEYLKKAVEAYNYDAAYLLLAELYNDLGEYQKALEAADNALKYRGKKSKISKGAIYYYKGLALKGLKKKEEAKKAFKLALKDRQYKQNAKYELDLIKKGMW